MTKKNAGSMVYQMRNCPAFVKLERRMASLRKAAAAAKKAGLPPPKTKEKLPSKTTLAQYRRHAVAFAVWARKRYGCRTVEEAGRYIQAYADALAAEGRSASTIHTYLAAVCRAYEMPMYKIKKPVRYTAENVQSRGRTASDKRADRSPECSARLYAFAAMVGIRREEYLHLRRDDLAEDESGYLCVVVRRGKGGKRQLQRIPEPYRDRVRAFFDGSGGFVFEKRELANKLGLHRLRHQLAWECYQAYLRRLESEPSYRRQLTEEVRRRWAAYCSRKWDAGAVRGKHVLRGKNRALAEAAGFPARYDRLALMAVSVFHLSHWRTDVTVSNYILAVARDRQLKGEDAEAGR